MKLARLFLIVAVFGVDCSIARADSTATDPKVFTRIRVHYIVTGKNLGEQHVERAVQLSAEKYCSASIMLGRTAEITHTFAIREAA